MDTETPEQGITPDAQPINAGSIASVSATEDTAPKTEPQSEENTEPTGKEARIQKKSDKDWQEKTEKANNWDRFVAAVTKDSDEKVEDDADLLTKSVSRITSLENDLERSKWERKNLPANLDKKVEDQWEEACKRKANPEDSWHKLPYDELLAVSGVKLESPEDHSEAKQDVAASNFNSTFGTINVSGGATDSSKEGMSALGEEIKSLAGL